MKLHDQAVVCLARHDDRTAVATLESRRLAIEPQPSLLLARSVAGITVLRQNRADIPLEVDPPVNTGRAVPALDRRGALTRATMRTARSIQALLNPIVHNLVQQ